MGTTGKLVHGMMAQTSSHAGKSAPTKKKSTKLSDASPISPGSHGQTTAKTVQKPDEV